MIKSIIRDIFFLRQISTEATADDCLQLATDLKDTLKANASGCVGMAANMIGVAKRAIIFDNNGEYIVMFNPTIIK
ncbi:MAG: peptide deformylase, partial [Oscillospiraceae bacterium]